MLFLAPYGEVPPITSEMMSADRVTEAAVALRVAAPSKRR